MLPTEAQDFPVHPKGAQDFPVHPKGAQPKAVLCPTDCA